MSGCWKRLPPAAAVAVATAQSAAEEHQRQRLAAAEAERSRWARELHDEALQGLASLRLVLATTEHTGEPAAIAAANRQAIGQLEVDIANLRALITELRPAALDQLGTAAAIEALADRLARTGLDVDVSIDLAYEQGRATSRHSPELETTIYRIIQEALTNATKHGSATRAVVEVIEDDRSVRISVRDNGTGFDPTTKSDGFGLVGMRERATCSADRYASTPIADGELPSPQCCRRSATRPATSSPAPEPSAESTGCRREAICCRLSVPVTSPASRWPGGRPGRARLRRRRGQERRRDRPQVRPRGPADDHHIAPDIAADGADGDVQVQELDPRREAGVPPAATGRRPPPFRWCSSPATYRALADGSYTF
jgi:two-component sensor histidine kinase